MDRARGTESFRRPNRTHEDPAKEAVHRARSSQQPVGTRFPIGDGTGSTLEGENPTMKMYFFDVTLKVDDHGIPTKTVIYKGARAWNELTARRIVLYQFLEGGFQVVRIDRVPERSTSTG
jgi:hypothetical protein